MLKWYCTSHFRGKSKVVKLQDHLAHYLHKSYFYLQPPNMNNCFVAEGDFVSITIS